MATNDKRGAERRRNPRVQLELVVHVDWDGGSEAVRTRDVSLGGAMVECERVFPVGSVLRLTHPETEEEADFRVAWVWPGDQPGQYRVGLEQVETTNFWGNAAKPGH
jgi:hypothetical protein